MSCNIDYCIESLVVRGAILMSRFLQGQEVDSFAWVYPQQGNEQMVTAPQMVSHPLQCTLFAGIVILGGSFLYGMFRYHDFRSNDFLSSLKVFQRQ